MRFDYRSFSVAAGLALAGVAAAELAAPGQLDHAALFMRSLIADRGASAVTTRLLEAAARDDPEAEFDLGVVYTRGRGVPKDYAEAGRWFRKAADHAHMWFSLAAAQREEGAAKERDDSAAKMTAAEIAESERMAGARRPSNLGGRL